MICFRISFIVYHNLPRLLCQLIIHRIVDTVNK